MLEREEQRKEANLSRSVALCSHLYAQILTHWAGWFYWACCERALFTLRRKSCCWSIINSLLLEFVHVKHDFTQQEHNWLCLVFSAVFISIKFYIHIFGFCLFQSISSVCSTHKQSYDIKEADHRRIQPVINMILIYGCEIQEHLELAKNILNVTSNKVWTFQQIYSMKLHKHTWT